MGSVQLKYKTGGSYTSYKTILCQSVRVSGKHSNDKKPNANLSAGIVEVATISKENPTYVVSGIRLNTGVSGALDYSDIITFYGQAFDGSNPIYLKVTYGHTLSAGETAGSTTDLTASDGSTIDIPVILESFDLNISHTDNAEGAIPVATLTFVETKTS